jgi:Uma2 family endonuclease
MTSGTIPSSRAAIVYPDSDGQPMAENTLQYQWIVTITGGLDDLFADDPAVFVAGDLFWYPVEGHPEIRMAPDTMVVFGRPKGHRGSYRQWEEGGVAPQVVFEVLSPGNRAGELSRKFGFYERHGVEEYYIYNPDPPHLELSGFVRAQDRFQEVEVMNGHVSPRLGVRFHLGEQGLRLYRPDGSPFLSYQALADDRREANRRAEQERQRAEQERQRAEHERQRAEQALRELEQLRQQLRPDPSHPT